MPANAHDTPAPSDPLPNSSHPPQVKTKKGKSPRPGAELPDEPLPAPTLPLQAETEPRITIDDIIADDSVVGGNGAVASKIPPVIKIRSLQKAKFFRIMPGAENKLVVNTLKLEREDTRPGEIDRFVLTNAMRHYVEDNLDYTVGKSVVHYCRYVQGQVFLIMANASSDLDANTWNSSMRDLLLKAETCWVRKVSDRDAQEYRGYEAKGQFRDRPWKVAPIKEAFLKALGKALIADVDHPILKRLRGEAETTEADL